MSVPADDVEHQTEIRRAGRHPVVWLGVAALVVLVAAVALAGRGGDRDAAEPPRPPAEVPTTPTSETLTTTQPVPAPDVHAVADGGGGPVPAVASDGSSTSSTSGAGAFEALQATPIATAGHVVVLVDGGRLLTGRPGSAFEPIPLAGNVSAIVASNEPGHVWARVTVDELALVDLDAGELTERIAVGADRVLGPAGFGVVTVDDAGAVAWRRPRFDPTPVPLPTDRTAIDAGGEVVLVEAPDPGAGGRRLEARSVIDGRLVQPFRLGSTDRPPVLALDGTSVALPTPDGWLVHDVASGQRLGRLPATPETPVWLGGSHFAVPAASQLIEISGSGPRRTSWSVVALAEQSP